MPAWKIPEDVLWRLHKGVRTAEARTIATTPGGSQPELRIYTNTAPKSPFAVSWSRVMKDERAARLAAAERKAEFLAAGWSEPEPPKPA
jgi:hypothetical protein